MRNIGPTLLDSAGLGATIDGDAFDSTSANRFKGLIDDLRIYDGDIMPTGVAYTDIEALAAGDELPPRGDDLAPAPIAHWSMDPVLAPSPDDQLIEYAYGPGADFSDPDNPYAGNGTKQTVKTVYQGPDYEGDFELLEEHTYEYDASGRMTSVTIVKNGVTVVEDYGYNDQNLRISRSVTESGNTVVTDYLLDVNNPTGYSQILEEYVDDELSKSYTIGHDVISQYDPINGVLTLLYDGHGSTRALVDGNGQIVQQFAYEAYGTMIEGVELTTAAQALTTILYSGEHFNARTGLQNLRTRELQLSTGTFPTMDDPRYGKIHDPISLNKYLYVHANPVMGVDPDGTEFTLSSLLNNLNITSLITSNLRLTALSTIAAGLGGTLLYIKFGLPTNIFKEPYLSYIRDSAVRYDLKPELLAAIIAAEQSDLNVKDLGDIPGAYLGSNTSIGLGQVNINTAIRHNLVGTSDRSAVISSLRDPRMNIEAVAKYLRIVANDAGPAAKAVGHPPSWQGVNLDLYKSPGESWDYSNEFTVILIGSEYTSKAWDWQRSSGGPLELPVHENWGRTVLRFYNDIVQQGAFK